MKKIFAGSFVILIHFIFSQNASAQKDDEFKMPPLPVVEMEPGIVNADLKALPPSPPPVNTVEINLPAEREKARKESEEREYRKDISPELKSEKD